MGRIKELGAILNEMYNNASQGEKVTMIYLFAISHAKEIQQNNYSVAEIVRYSGISQSYKIEVSKGIKLKKYVEIGNKNHSSTSVMTFLELGKILEFMYYNSKKEKESTTAVRLFGVKYATEIKNCKQSVETITISAGLSKNYAVEISKGIKLSKYVKCKSIINDKFDTRSIADDMKKPIIKSRFKKLQETGLQAETYFVNNYNDINLFKGGKLEDARLFGDGYDFQVDVETNLYLAEIKGIRKNKGLFRLTENEYQKATEYKNDYIVTLVLNLDKKPRFLTIDNPIKNLTFKEKIIKQNITKEYHLVDNIS